MSHLEDQRRAEDVLERVTLAVKSLAVGEGDVRSRLEHAVESLLPLRDVDFPCELGAEFSLIIQQATKYDSQCLLCAEGLPHVECRKDGTLHTTMGRIRNSTGAKIARQIWCLYSKLKRIASPDRFIG